MDYYEKFIYFMEKDAKDDGKIETADRPAQAGKGKSGKTDLKSAKKVEEKSTQKERALKKIQEEREMRNAVKRELEEGLAKNPIPEPPEWVKKTLLPV